MTEYEPEQVTITDKRRLDPETGSVRDTEPGSPAVEGTVVDEAPAPERDLAAEYLEQAQRVTAEYANYRKRVDRDRSAVVEVATASVLSELLPLLDDIERARQHGDLTGGFKGVGEGLEAVVDKLGLERFGEAGDAFDPSVHEALMQAPEDATITVATAVQVLQQGYRLKAGRVLRPARVAVAEPASA